VIAASAFAWAPTLDAETCLKLRAERESLVQDGIKGYIEKGAQWGQQNLSAEQLGAVRRFIGLEESLRFRCEQPKPLHAKAETPDPEEDAPHGQAEPAPPSPVKKTKRRSSPPLPSRKPATIPAEQSRNP
jgi:hypothetical protein